ncbi:MAG: DNA polymerase III subunit delta', partial [Myxococcales bacterium]
MSFLRAALARGRAHHAYLFAGPKGVGKELLARLFAQAANCDEPEARRPCGTCVGCSAIRRGSHPDVTWVLPQSEAVARGLISKADLDGAPSREIRVDEVRALSRRLALAPAVGRRKVAIVTPAEALNERAQNTLL